MSHVQFRARDERSRARSLARAAGAALALATACGASQSADRPVRHAETKASSANAASSTTPAASAALAGASPPAGPAVPAPEMAIAQLERALAEEATLSDILRLARARNPELGELEARVRAARAIAPAAGRLPDPEFEYQLWAQPLARPHALGEAGMHMFGLQQTFPAFGSLRAESEAAQARTGVAVATRRTREQDVALRVHQAYAEYYRAEREYRIHLEHAALAERSLELARAAYTAGSQTQEGVLRIAVELSRLHTGIAAIDRDRRTARALLNTLMARPAAAPLGPPAAPAPLDVDVRAERLERELVDRRPEIAAEKGAVRMRERELDAARASARFPNVMVGVQYMFMPPESERHNYGVTLSMTLPWLNPAHTDAVRAAEANLAAEQSALSSTELAAHYELYEATVRLGAARETLAIIERDLLPRAEQSYTSAEAAYRAGRADSLGIVDALRSLLDVRLEHERARSSLLVALADVERAAGQPISKRAGKESD
jgi:outer membrane protein, heavy metal efflux system